MAQSHTGDGPIDEQLTTLPGLGEADEDEVEDLVDALTGHGPEDSAVVMSEGQAEALVRRKFVGQTRQEAADAMDCSVWTVDGNLTRAKGNLETVDEAALVFDAAGAFGLERVDVVGSHSVDESDDLEAGDVDGQDEEVVDNEAAAWGRLMARETVVEVIRPAGSGYVSVEIEDGESDVDDVKGDLDALGYPVKANESHAVRSSRTTVRAWKRGEAPDGVGDDEADESDESGVESEDGDEADESPDETDERREVLLLGGEPVPADTDGLSDDVLEQITADLESLLEVDLESVENGETLGAVEIDGDGFSFDPADGLEDSPTCHYCGDLFDVDPEADADLTVAWNEDPDERPACGSCLADVAMGDELEPLPEFVDEDDQDEDIEENGESAAESDEGDEDNETSGEDDESDVYRCECGSEFGSAGALGGHSKYCDVGDESEGSA